jgi:DNA-binding winged helix-turn-helix (wHTH) protein
MEAGFTGGGDRGPITSVSLLETGWLGRRVTNLRGAIAMASKTFSIYDEKPGSQPHRTAAVGLRMSAEAQPPAMALLPPRIASPYEDSRLRHLQTEPLGSENYQVALVPPARPAPRFRVGVSDTASPILVLPLTWKELIARVRAEADHSQSLQHPVVRFGAVRVDLFRVEVSRSEIPVVLTALEFKVLKFFVTSPGRVISRDELLNQVWGFENYPCTRTVDNHVMRLRKKLETDPACPVHFQTVHGIGYKFVPEASPAVAEQRM